jgi:sialic acid synthase SpsE/mannose-6-phosphate isomerase-like protein (cupin superfamily)
MANNHMGDVNHGKLIVDELSNIVQKYDLNAAVKLQFRQLDTFIHNDFLNSDLKYVKRFKETELSKNQFKELVEYIRLKGLKTCSTAFDNDSIPWLEELDISIIKVASCSIDDWPLLEVISEINKKIVISTAGASIDILHRVYDLFKSKDRDFAFMHCVGDYPTPHDKSNLHRISLLRHEFPDIEIGYSTHESPRQKTTSTYAMAMGCTILEKHVALPTEKIKINDYSLQPSDLESLMSEIVYYNEAVHGRSVTEVTSLRALKRGMYFSDNLTMGDTIEKNHLYFCMPVQTDSDHYHYDASNINDVVGEKLACNVSKDQLVTSNLFQLSKRNRALNKFRTQISSMLDDAKIAYGNEELEISCHFGLNNFHNIGCAIINRVNREYCKKLIIVLPNQRHPTHRHIQKEECFELLHGDCEVTLDKKIIKLKQGKPLLVHQQVNHSFRSEQGCILEEISSTHIKGDSVYSDSNINKLPLEKRKIITKL